MQAIGREANPASPPMTSSSSQIPLMVPFAKRKARTTVTHSSLRIIKSTLLQPEFCQTHGLPEASKTNTADRTQRFKNISATFEASSRLCQTFPHACKAHRISRLFAHKPNIHMKTQGLSHTRLARGTHVATQNYLMQTCQRNATNTQGSTASWPCP